MSWEIFSRPVAPHVRDGLFVVVRKGGQVSLMRQVAVALTGGAGAEEFACDVYFDPDRKALAVKAASSGSFVARLNGRTWVIDASAVFAAYGVLLDAATRYPAQDFGGGMWGCVLRDGVKTGRTRKLGGGSGS